MAFKKGEGGNHGGMPHLRGKAWKSIKVDEILKARGCCPISILAEIAMNSEQEALRCKAAEALASYIAPKLKQIEHKGDAQNPFTFTINIGNRQYVNGQIIEQIPEVKATAPSHPNMVNLLTGE